MVNDLIKAISTKLFSVFGEDKKIYRGKVEQDLQVPCFLIKVLKVSDRQLVGTRHDRKHPFDIHFFPQNIADDEITYDIAESMEDCLETIRIANGDTFHGTDIAWEVIDDVLHFFVNYNAILREVETEVDSMESFSAETTLQAE